MRYLTSCGVAIDIRIDPQTTVVADKAWLAFILTQLIINAAKYDAETITFEACENDEEGPHACTMLEVRDDGCGHPGRRRATRLRPRLHGRGGSRARVGDRAWGSSSSPACARKWDLASCSQARRAWGLACRSAFPTTVAACT